jgi:hypothetical protein
MVEQRMMVEENAGGDQQSYLVEEKEPRAWSSSYKRVLGVGRIEVQTEHSTNLHTQNVQLSKN